MSVSVTNLHVNRSVALESVREEFVIVMCARAREECQY